MHDHITAAKGFLQGRTKVQYTSVGGGENDAPEPTVVLMWGLAALIEAIFSE